MYTLSSQLDVKGVFIEPGLNYFWNKENKNGWSDKSWTGFVGNPTRSGIFRLANVFLELLLIDQNGK